MNQAQIEPLRSAVYRPGEIRFDFPGYGKCISLSWEDGKLHRQGIGGKFVGWLEDGIDSAGRPFRAEVESQSARRSDL